MREIYEDSGGSIQLGELSFLANGVMFTRKLPEQIMPEFTRRWWQALGSPDLTASRLEVTAAGLQSKVEELFPAAAPGWPTARLHSPDVHLCAENAQALERGDFTAVLGELHVAWLTCDAELFTRFHPDPEALREAVQRDVGDRVVLRYPPDYPEFTARLAPTLTGPGDAQLVYADAPAAQPESLLPVAALTVSLVDDRLQAHAPDGRTWALTELFSPFLSAMAADAFKLIPAGPHTPRVTVDRLVVQRETWRTTVGETGLTSAAGEAQRYLAVRAWRDRLGLPERVFAKLGNESKPFCVDFTGPASVASFIAMVRAAGDVPLVFSAGSASISAIRSSRSGMTLIRARRRKVCGSTRSAVPAQLLLTTMTSRWPAGAAADAAAGAATMTARKTTAAAHLRWVIIGSSRRGRVPSPTPRRRSPRRARVRRGAPSRRRFRRIC